MGYGSYELSAANRPEVKEALKQLNQPRKAETAADLPQGEEPRAELKDLLKSEAA